MIRKRWLVPFVAVVGLGALTPSYVRVYRVFGSSDAPSFLVGDRILVNKAAYDLRLPYTEIVIFAHSEPQRGDVVMFRSPGDDVLVFKRVAGCPGDTVVMRDNRLEVNGVPMRYEPVRDDTFRPVAKENDLGAIIERESENGPPHLITYTPGSSPDASFGPIQVPDGQYFVVGDNRDNSRDSRAYGAIPRPSIVGRVIPKDRSAR